MRRLSETLGPLEERIGYQFRDLGLLEHALTHRSRAHEDASGGVIDNESLEFLGDAVLGFVIADMLFTRFPTHSEGYKSKVKAAIVSAASLTRLAEEIDLGRFVLLGRGEEKTGGRQKHAILADSFEALIAAIYLDGGIDAARDVHRVAVRSAHRRGAAIRPPRRRSPRTGSPRCRNGCRPTGRGLPQLPARRGRGPRSSQALRRRSARRRRGRPAAPTGRSKKDAEQQAAREALAGRSRTKRLDGSQSISMMPDCAASAAGSLSAASGRDRGVLARVMRQTRLRVRRRPRARSSSSLGGTGRA